VHSFIQLLYNHSFSCYVFIHSVMYSFIQLVMHSFIQLCIHSFSYVFIHSVSYAFIHSVVHSFIHLLPGLGDLALLVDTSHPMIRPELERALEQARKILQARGKFCVQVSFCNSLGYPRSQQCNSSYLIIF